MSNLLHGKSRNILPQLFASAVLLLLGGIIGYTIHGAPVVQPGSYGPIRTLNTEYRLIHPLLACDFPNNQAGEHLQILKHDLTAFISSQKRQGKVTEASVFLRMLKSGENIGIDELSLYNPASMVKVMLMISYAHAGESHPDLFAKKLTMTSAIMGSEDLNLYYGSTSLTVGESYRIGDLIDKMIIDSDNGAKDLLLTNLSNDDLARTLGDFGVVPENNHADELRMSPKDISVFFTTLYNATYLDPLHSEVALELLLRTTFKEGLVGGVPFGTKVAHKFGEYVLPESNGKVNEVELHDCGIVYAPNNPYFLCVMTRGTSHEALASLISNISSRVYGVATSPQP